MALKKKLKKIKKELLRKERLSSLVVRVKYTKNICDIQDCLCTDSKNRFKELYSTEYQAEKQAKFLLDEQGISLSIYPCRYSYGWHLTKG